MRERGRYQIQLMKTRSSSGVGSKVDLEFNVDTLRISDCDEQDDSNGYNTGNSASTSIVNALKRNSTGISSMGKVDPETGEILDANPLTGVPVAKVRAETDSTKLRQFLNNLQE
jgi:hypothetical protein